jgi:hypothetical protein
MVFKAAFAYNYSFSSCFFEPVSAIKLFSLNHITGTQFKKRTRSDDPKPQNFGKCCKMEKILLCSVRAGYQHKKGAVMLNDGG